MDREAAKVWVDEDQFGLTLLCLLIDRYSAESINWSPHTWMEEIKDDCGVEIHPRNVDKLAALSLFLTQPHEFYFSPAGFSNIAHGLSATWFNTSTYHPLSTAECAWTLLECLLVSPPEKEEKFSAEIIRLVNMTAKYEGYGKLPAIFKNLGISDDPGVKYTVDLSGDPDLASVVAESVEDLESDLNLWIKDRATLLVEKLANLPVKRGNPKKVALELANFLIEQ